MDLVRLQPKNVNAFRCEACIKGKSERLPARQTGIRPLQPLAPVQINIWGPANVESSGEARYFLTCMMILPERFLYLTFLKQVSEVLAGIQHNIALAVRQTSHRVEINRSHNRNEFRSNNWSKNMRENGIEHQYTPSDSHAQTDEWSGCI
jgi:hypothetical protein